MKIAICSVNQNAYSETFIQAHKNLLKDSVLYYNTGWIPHNLESNSILPSGKISKVCYRSLLRKFGILKYSDQQFGFYKSLKHEKPDVILAEYAVCGAEIFSISRDLNIPLVIHCHGFDVSNKPTIEAYKKRYEEAFYYASAVIGVSKVMCSKLEELGCPKEKIVYTCCGPNPEFLKQEPGYKEPLALAVGRFVEKKAPHLTLFAFSQVLKKIPNAKLQMVGEGTLLPVCRDIVHALKMENSVNFAGSLNPEQILLQMQSALFFVQHSKTADEGDTEGTPVVILEAQAAALPVISTYHAGIPDVVVHNETGLLSNEGEIDEMAANMISLFDNKEMCKRLGSNARERIKKHFTMEQHILTLQKVLNNAASGNL